MRAFSILSATTLLAATMAGAQAAPNHTALGDREYAAMNPTNALSHYEAAIEADPKNYDALWKASRSAVDLGSYDQTSEQRGTLYKNAELYARRAVAANPNDAEAHFHLARALGKNALTLGPRARIKYATDVRTQALECLKLNPKHPGCLHVMGVWNAEVMRLSGFTRLLARNLLGGRVFGSASWKDAQRYLEEAVAAAPDRIVHRIDLGEIYRDTNQKPKARTEFETALKLNVSDVNDRHYKAQAERALKAL